MQLEHVMKCRLFTRKWHVMEQSLIWQNGIWLVEYNSNTWKIASPPECYRNVKSWPMNYRHNSFKKVRSAVLPHTHFLTLGGFGVVWKFYFSSIWDDSRVTALWLNWTFKIMGNSCSSCGGKITEGNYCERFVHLAFILVQAAFQGKFTRIE